MMTPRAFLIAVFTLFTLSGCGGGASSSDDADVKAAARNFWAALQGSDGDSIKASLASILDTAKFEELFAALEATIHTYADATVTVEDTRAEGDCGAAFVLVVDAAGNKTYKSTYLQRQGGAWKVLVTPESYHGKFYRLSHDQYAAFKKLEQWYEKSEMDRM